MIRTMTDAISAPKKTRSSRPKVRTGCITCKARRVKCDETKPACVRCTITGRNCDGYAPLKPSSVAHRALAPARATDAPDTSRASSRASRNTPAHQAIEVRTESRPLAPLVDASQTDLTPKERWFFDFFRHVTARTNAAFFNEEFWGQLVHQASEIQPAVRHSAIGISALHWGSLTKNDSVPDDQDPSFALQQCTKAFEHLHANLEANITRRQRMEAVLISCGILLALAFGQGDARGCGCHIRAGSDLLQEWQRFQMDDSPIGLIVLKSFNQLHLDWLPQVGPEERELKSYSYPLRLAVDYQSDVVVETTEDACGILLILGWLTLQMKPQRVAGQPTACASLALLQRLDYWKASIVKKSDDLPQHNETLVILDIWREVVLIKSLTDDRLDQGEMRYDDYLSHFQRTVELGKLLLYGDLSTSWTWSAVVTPLFFCAFKCRDWVTRREAVNLLLAWRHEQGVWSLSGPALVVNRLIDIESRDYQAHEIIAEKSRIDATYVDFPSCTTKKVQFWYRKPALSNQDSGCGTARIWKSELIPY